MHFACMTNTLLKDEEGDACFADIKVSQGSVSTYARCDGIFNIHLTVNLPRTFQWCFFKNRLRFDRIMVMSLWPRFFGPPSILVHCRHPDSRNRIKHMVLATIILFQMCRRPHIWNKIKRNIRYKNYLYYFILFHVRCADGSMRSCCPCVRLWRECHLCRVAGNSVWSHIACELPSRRG